MILFCISEALVSFDTSCLSLLIHFVVSPGSLRNEMNRMRVLNFKIVRIKYDMI